MKYTNENCKALALQLLKACAETTHGNKGNRNQRILLTLKFVIETGIYGVGCRGLSLPSSLVQAASCSWHAAPVIMRLFEVVYLGRKSWLVCMCCLPCAGSESQHRAPEPAQIAVSRTAVVSGSKLKHLLPEVHPCAVSYVQCLQAQCIQVMSFDTLVMSYNVVP